MRADETAQLPQRGKQRGGGQRGFVVGRLHRLKIRTAGNSGKGYGVTYVVHTRDVEQ